MSKPAYHPNDFKRYTGIYRLHRISLPKVLPLIASPYGQTTIKRRNRKRKTRITPCEKVIICFCFLCVIIFNSKNSTFYSHINKLSNNHQGTLWLNLGIWIDSSKNN